MTDEPNDCWHCDGTGIGDPHGQTPCPECGGTCVERPERPSEPPDDFDDPSADFIYDPLRREPD